MTSPGAGGSWQDRGPRPGPTGVDFVLAALVAITVFSGGLYVIERFPVFAGIDSYIRFSERDSVRVLGWLPGLQTFLVAAATVTTDVPTIRGCLAAFGSIMVAMGFLLTSRLYSRVAGLVFAALIATMPTLMVLATVPYQEVFFLMWIFLALFLMRRMDELDGSDPQRERKLWWATAVVLNVACLTRFEGWLMVSLVSLGVFTRAFTARGLREAVVRGGRTFVAYGGVVICLWLLFLGRTMIYPGQRTTLAAGPGALLHSTVDYFLLMVEGLGLPLFLLACAGIVRCILSPRGARTHWTILGFLCLSVTMVIAVEPYGWGPLREQARQTGQPSTPIGDPRQSTFCYAFLLMYAAAGIEWIVSWIARKAVTFPVRGKAATYAALVLFIAGYTQTTSRDGMRQLGERAKRPEVVIAYRVSQRIVAKELDAALLIQRFPDRQMCYRLATYTGVPFHRVLRYADDETRIGKGLDPRLIEGLKEHLGDGRAVHLIDFQRDRRRLKAVVRKVLEMDFGRKIRTARDQVKAAGRFAQIVTLIPDS